MGRGRSCFCTTTRKETFYPLNKRCPAIASKTVNTERKQKIIAVDERFVDFMKGIDPQILAGILLDKKPLV